jgi:hypothetical protein
MRKLVTSCHPSAYPKHPSNLLAKKWTLKHLPTFATVFAGKIHSRPVDRPSRGGWDRGPFRARSRVTLRGRGFHHTRSKCVHRLAMSRHRARVKHRPTERSRCLACSPRNPKRRRRPVPRAIETPCESSDALVGALAFGLGTYVVDVRDDGHVTDVVLQVHLATELVD